MIGLMVLLQATVTAAPTSPPDSDIVIEARNVEDARRVLKSCKARRCPPNEEVKAALVLATRQFLAGDYGGSRGTLLVSRHRNARFEKTYPLEISDLHRALNSVSNLDGRPDSARISAFDATDALRAGLAADDPRIQLQRLDTARQLAREGRLVGATQLLDDVAAKAKRKGDYGVEAQALFQGAVLYAALASRIPAYRGTARRWRNRVIARDETEFAEYRNAIGLLDVQVAALNGKSGDREPMLTEVKPVEADTAFLIYEPVTRYAVSDNGLGYGGGGNTAPEWADVAFWVRPDGSVANVTVVGRSKSPPGSWLAKKTAAVERRRYAPLKRPSNDPGLYRVERYSMVYSLGLSTGSSIPVRSGQGLMETTDISAAHHSPAG